MRIRLNVNRHIPKISGNFQNASSSGQFKLSGILNDSSAWFLLVTNIIVIFIALAQKWSLYEIMMAYWAQSVIIGFFHFFRILTLKKFSTEGILVNGKPLENSHSAKVGMAFFFAAHYGLFHFVYLMFLAWSPFMSSFMQGAIKPGLASSSVLGSSFLIALTLFFINHLFSFIYSYKNDSEKPQHLGRVMFYPYARILPMHLTIIFGGFLFYSSSILVLFLILKAFADLILHTSQHSD